MNKLSAKPSLHAQVVTLSEIVATVRELSASDAEAARVINHLLLTRRIRFATLLEAEAQPLLDS
jgi:hypothetical protein